MNNVFVISGPSGSGQDSIIEMLAQKVPLVRVITTTTRKKRPGESDGHPYHFVSQEEFQKMRASNLFLESAQTYNGEWYGVTRDELTKASNNHEIVIWKVDYKGVQKIKSLFPEIRTFFIEVPLDVLRARLEKRDSPDKKYLEERMRYTKEWETSKHLYDYCIKNNDGELEKAVTEIKEIIEGNLSR